MIYDGFAAMAAAAPPSSGVREAGRFTSYAAIAERAAHIVLFQVIGRPDLVEDVHDFISFFNQVLAQRLVRLGAVPGAAVRGA